MPLVDFWGAIVRKVDNPKDKRMRVDFKVAPHLHRRLAHVATPSPSCPCTAVVQDGVHSRALRRV
jgi:hypothetical protein